jgi:hypothetical protein
MKQELTLLRDIIRDYTPDEYPYEPETGKRFAKKSDYDHIDIISKRLSQSVVPRIARIAATPDYLQKVLEGLVADGRAVTKFSHSGQVQFWKKPTKKFTKMKKFEWKKMIVEVLDMHKGLQLTHKEIVGALKHQYTLGSPPEELHGSIGSALDRLSKDGKLKRFHRKKVKKGYVYWTTPVSPGPLPLPRNR